MSNPFYTVSGNPGTGAPLTSAAIRTEFTAIAAAFDKLPTTLTANKAVVVNSGGTGLTITSGSLALGGDFTVSGASALTLTTTNTTNVTLPTTGTLATLAGSESLSNKTLVTPVLGTPASGTLTNCTGLPAASIVAGALSNGMTATTQSAGDNSTKVATDAYVDRQVGQTVSTQTGTSATGTGQIPFDNTIPQSGEGDQYMTLAITPKSAASTLIIDVVWVGASASNAQMTGALFQDATAGALAAASQNAVADTMLTLSFRHVMVSGTTSSTTFKVRAGTNAIGLTTFNGRTGSQAMGGAMASSIVIREVL